MDFDLPQIQIVVAVAAAVEALLLLVPQLVLSARTY